MTLHSQKLRPVLSHGQSDSDIGAILLIDDPEDLVVLRTMLEPLRQPVITASSGGEALRQVLAREFAVILLDVQMSGLNGYDLARQLKAHEHSRHTPIIFLTGANRPDEEVFEGYSVGAVDYMSKPLDAEVVRARVAVIVELHRRGKMLERQARLLHESQSRAS